MGLQRVAIAGGERLLATVRDIRDRKAADQALVASEEAYRTIFQHSSESIWVHDVATGEMLDVNAAGCELYGYTHDEMMRLGHDALLYPGSAYTVERVARYMAAAMAGETPRFEWLGRHRDGSEVWGEVTLRRVTVGGKDRILATVRDIKDRKRVEAVLREANEQLERRVAERTAALEEANAALEAEIAEREAAERALREAIAAAEAATRARELILSAVAHDLRNPLASIAMDAEMTRHLISADAQPAQYRAVSRIERTAQRMGRLIDDLLDVSRLEHGSFAVHLQTLAPDTVFIEADAMLQPLARSRSIRLEFAGPAGLPVITADGERLLQVFSNLVGNALKFTPAGGDVRVTWSAVDGELVVAIADSGSGIAAENLPNVFTAFWRETHGAAERGLGLGLVITRAIVEAHGGRIRIESTAGAGTTVHFAIPFAADDARADDAD